MPNLGAILMSAVVMSVNIKVFLYTFNSTDRCGRGTTDEKAAICSDMYLTFANIHIFPIFFKYRTWPEVCI